MLTRLYNIYIQLWKVCDKITLKSLDKRIFIDILTKKSKKIPIFAPTLKSQINSYHKFYGN